MWNITPPGFECPEGRVVPRQAGGRLEGEAASWVGQLRSAPVLSQRTTKRRWRDPGCACHEAGVARVTAELREIFMNVAVGAFERSTAGGGVLQFAQHAVFM